MAGSWGKRTWERIWEKRTRVDSVTREGRSRIMGERRAEQKWVWDLKSKMMGLDVYCSGSRVYVFGFDEGLGF